MTGEVVCVSTQIIGEDCLFRADRFFNNWENKLSPAQSYQSLLESSDKDIICYIHDDLEFHTGHYNWKSDIAKIFQDDYSVAVVGLGGAPRLGHPVIYKRPYEISQMARAGYVSNQTDWEVHGGRETGTRQVAVVDAFFMAIRRDFLLECGGWPTEHLTHHCLDLWVCLEAARRGRKVMMTGISATHFGGGTSTKAAYQEASWLQGGSTAEDHARPHRWLYEEYRDVLPLEIK